MTCTTTKRTATLALLAVLALATGACSDQPRPQCTVGRGNIAFVYRPTSSESTTCTSALRGETVAAGVYYASKPDGLPDYSRTSIALEPSTMTENVALGGDPDEDHAPRSVGGFTTAEPTDDGFCHVEEMSPAVQEFPHADATVDGAGEPLTPERPATAITYEWSHVRVYVTPANQGNQVRADLAITRDGCRTSYTASGLWPAVSCASRARAPGRCSTTSSPCTASRRASASP